MKTILSESIDGSVRIGIANSFCFQYTSEGYEEKIQHHLDRMKEERDERNKNKNWPFPPPKIEEPKTQIQRDYNKLVLTMYDMIQFELRHIQIDEDCILDGYSCEYHP